MHARTDITNAIDRFTNRRIREGSRRVRKDPYTRMYGWVYNGFTFHERVRDGFARVRESSRGFARVRESSRESSSRRITVTKDTPADGFTTDIRRIGIRGLTYIT